jgi:hypothetical protein
MDDNQTPEQTLHLIFMSVGALNALLGAAIMMVYFGLLPNNIPDFNIPYWVIGILGITWFLSGVGVVAFSARRVNKWDIED